MANPIFGADSRLDTDTLTTTPTENVNFPDSNLFDDRVFTIFKPTSAATEVIIKTDAGGGNTVDVDYFMALGHDFFDPDEDGNGALRVRFESSTDDISYVTHVDVNLATDNQIILRTFTKVTKRFYRLKLTRGSSFIPSIGQLQWGARVEFPTGVNVGFDPQEERLKSASTRSQTGNIVGAVRFFTERSIRIQGKLILDSFIRDETTGGFQDFWDDHASQMKPFVFAWNPGNPGNFEKDALFAVIDPRRGIRRPLRTQLDVGLRDIMFSITGVKE